MLFVTGADHRFTNIVSGWIDSITIWGHTYRVYDLGLLGFGIKGCEETDLNFTSRGYYNDIEGKWKSTGLWKPRVIKNVLETTKEDFIYLDADAIVQRDFNIDFSAFDIGVVERVPNPDQDPTKVFLRGQYNAGVIFFRNNDKVKNFVNSWIKKIEETNNDQAALSLLLQEINVDVKVFPKEYNSNTKDERTIIHHHTGSAKFGKQLR